jgi:hypothetical protein
MTISFSARVAVPESVLIRTLGDGESVLLALDSEQYFGLNASGTRMWTALTTTNSIQDAYEMLLQEYEVEPEQLRQDLEALIVQLLASDLVQLHES